LPYKSVEKHVSFGKMLMLVKTVPHGFQPCAVQSAAVLDANWYTSEKVGVVPTLATNAARRRESTFIFLTK